MHISDRASLSTDPSKWINVDHATLAVRIHVFSWTSTFIPKLTRVASRQNPLLEYLYIRWTRLMGWLYPFCLIRQKGTHKFHRHSISRENEEWCRRVWTTASVQCDNRYLLTVSCTLAFSISLSFPSWTRFLGVRSPDNDSPLFLSKILVNDLSHMTNYPQPFVLLYPSQLLTRESEGFLHQIQIHHLQTRELIWTIMPYKNTDDSMTFLTGLSHPPIPYYLLALQIHPLFMMISVLLLHLPAMSGRKHTGVNYLSPAETLAIQT